MRLSLTYGAGRSVRRRSLAVAAAVALAGLVGGSAVGATTPPDSTAPDDSAATSDSSATSDGAAAGADPCAMRMAPAAPTGPPPDATAPGDTTPTSGSTATTGTAPSSDTAPASAPAEPTAIAVSLTETSIDGLPTDLVAGVADVAVTDETESSGGEVNFTLVEPGTDPATFATDLGVVFEGGPFPDYFLNTSGVAADGMITLDEGEYIVWIDLASNVERPSTAEDILTATMTVGPGDDNAVIPDTNDQIRAGDYLFAADIVPCDSTLTFTNSSDNQFHHLVVVDFGTQDPVTIEQLLPEFISSAEDAPPPEGLDMSQVNFEFAFSGVFGPGGSGTFEADFQPGNTYAVLCFIQDREGGAPHAIQHQMYDVFQVADA